MNIQKCEGIKDTVYVHLKHDGRHLYSEVQGVNIHCEVCYIKFKDGSGEVRTDVLYVHTGDCKFEEISLDRDIFIENDSIDEEDFSKVEEAFSNIQNIELISRLNWWDVKIAYSMKNKPFVKILDIIKNTQNFETEIIDGTTLKITYCLDRRSIREDIPNFRGMAIDLATFSIYQSKTNQNANQKAKKECKNEKSKTFDANVTTYDDYDKWYNKTFHPYVTKANEIYRQVKQMRTRRAVMKSKSYKHAKSSSPNSRNAVRSNSLQSKSKSSKYSDLPTSKSKSTQKPKVSKSKPKSSRSTRSMESTKSKVGKVQKVGKVKSRKMYVGARGGLYYCKMRDGKRVKVYVRQ